MRLKLLFAWLFLLCLPLSSSQESSSKQSKELWLDLGMIIGRSYTNECLGIWFPIPDGWEVDSAGMSTPGKAVHRANGALGLLQFYQRANLPIGNWINLRALPATDAISAREFVTNLVHLDVTARPQVYSLVRDTFSVEYSGKTFFRSDYKHALRDGGTLYHAAAYTRFRDYFIGETVMAGSVDELNHAVDSLQDIIFQQDQINPKCVMGPAEMPYANQTHGVIGGIISDTPQLPPAKPTQPR